MDKKFTTLGTMQLCTFAMRRLIGEIAAEHDREKCLAKTRELRGLAECMSRLTDKCDNELVTKEEQQENVNKAMKELQERLKSLK